MGARLGVPAPGRKPVVTDQKLRAREGEDAGEAAAVARETGERLRDASKRIQFDVNEAPRELQAAAYRLQLQRYQNELTQLRYLLTEAPLDEQQELTQRVFQVSGLVAQTKRALDARTLMKSNFSQRQMS